MPRRNNVDVKEQLLAGALSLFHARGYNDASVQDIAAAAGVPKGSMFNHFRDKETLALEVLDRYGQDSGMDMLVDEEKAPIERLEHHFTYLADSYEAFGYERGCLLGNFASEMSAAHPPVRAALKVMFDYWCSLVEQNIRTAQSRGDMDAALDSEQISNFLVNSWEGAVLRMKVVRNRRPADDFFKLCFGIILATPSR